MAEKRTELYIRRSVQSRRDQRSPGNRTGVSQHQAVIEWGTSERMLYELEHAGRLVGIHVGNRVWYSRAQLTAVLGEPPQDPAKGGNQQRFERLIADAA